MKIRGLILCLGLTLEYGVSAAAEDFETVGIVVAVQGTVTMQPATMTPPMRLRPFDELGPLSILDSQSSSRCKVLFTDDSLLTLGENSRLEVTEQTYRAGNDQRAFVSHLIRGAVRALVARSFEGDNSTFEIHAGTAVATARGTYFVVW
ncbi:MAG TPA: FecR family protein, partial [Nitrospira sp.]|nr:FecR family protein [Nitrospira sp.]